MTWLIVTVAAVLLIARGARHLYRASGALIDHMTGPEMIRAARHWDELGGTIAEVVR